MRENILMPQLFKLGNTSHGYYHSINSKYYYYYPNTTLKLANQPKQQNISGSEVKIIDKAKHFLSLNALAYSAHGLKSWL